MMAVTSLSHGGVCDGCGGSSQARVTQSVRLSRSGVKDAADADDDVELCQILKYCIAARL